jgi:hypothetical protein
MTILITLGLLYRGWIFRHLIIYRSIAGRPNYPATEINLIKYINANISSQPEQDIESIVKIGLSLTSKQLNFTFDKNDNDPNKLVISKNAHCVGYASFFATTCNFLFEKYHISDSWVAKHQVGQLYFLETNVHKYISSSFFKNHDFVTIENKKTGEILAVDPTVNDYLNIDFITYSK